MQAPALPNHRFLIFTGQLAICMHYQNYGTFEEAWAALRDLVRDMQMQAQQAQQAPLSLTMIHASAEECRAANPHGAGGNAYQKQWPACTRNLGPDAETRRVLGDGCIVMLQW